MNTNMTPGGSAAGASQGADSDQTADHARLLAEGRIADFGSRRQLTVRLPIPLGGGGPYDAITCSPDNPACDDLGHQHPGHTANVGLPQGYLASIAEVLRPGSDD